MHEQCLTGCRPALAQLRRTVTWMEGVQVHAQRHRPDVRRIDTVELLPREAGGAHDDVVVRRGARVAEARQPPGSCGWQHHPGEPVETLVADHHRDGVVLAAPAAHGSQRQSIRDLERGRLERGHSWLYWVWQHSAVTAGERNL